MDCGSGIAVDSISKSVSRNRNGDNADETGYCKSEGWLLRAIEMPRKIRELIRTLERAGFVNRGGKGSHRNYQHPVAGRITISGKLNDDAKPYQEREVDKKVAEAEP